MKFYYHQHAKDHPFRVGHRVWIYNPTVKQGLSKKLCSLWHGPFCLEDQITPASFKVTDLQGKLQKGSVHVNQMKQHFKYDYPLQYNHTGIFPKGNYEPLESPAQSCENREMKFRDIFLENYIEKLAEISLLSELMKPLQLKQKTKRNQGKDNHFDITRLPTRAFNRGKQSATHLVGKKTSTSDYDLSNCVFDSVDQSISQISPATINCKNKKQKMQIFQTAPPQLLPTTITFTLWNR